MTIGTCSEEMGKETGLSIPKRTSKQRKHNISKRIPDSTRDEPVLSNKIRQLSKLNDHKINSKNVNLSIHSNRIS